METRIPFLEVSDAIVASGADSLYLCMQCGLCTGTCPWRLVPGEASEQFNIRWVQRLGQLGLEGFESENCLFACTTCKACAVRCPRGVDIIGNVRGMRSMLAEVGTIPGSLKPIAGSLHAQGNPWSGDRGKRTDWIKDIEVPTFSENTEYFLSVCCTSCYDARGKRIARAIANVLTRAGVSFGVIGEEESCCGESVRKTGGEKEYKTLAKENIKAFVDAGVKKIVVSSPHCYHTFKNEYPEFMVKFEVVHMAQLLFDLIREGRIELKKELGRRVTYHDPCYLGRHNGVYDEPRGILGAVPGLELVELADSRKNSLCCGGGGGRIWMDTPKGERFSDLRLRQAGDVGAEVLATACPYCITMFEDSRLSLELEDKIAIKDITEIAAEAM